MLDIKFILDNQELVKKAILDKVIRLDLDRLISIDRKRRELTIQVEGLRKERNQAAKARDIERGKAIKTSLDSIENQLRDIQSEYDQLMLYVPNIPSADSPVGPDSSFNREILSWGNKKEYRFKVLDHLELGKLLDIIDFEAGTKVSGFRGYFLKNEGAILHWAVLQYALSKILENGYTLMVPPTLVHQEVLIGSGHFPFGRENIYQIANPGKLESGQEIKNPLFLTGTSEPSLLAYFMDKTVDEDSLPIKLCALTQCYRSEVGDYGKDTKGLYRIHEFAKVEQVIICKNNLEESDIWFKSMQQIHEGILQELDIPYRVVQTSTGDMGAGKYRMNDVEVWMPGRGSYGESCSNSNLTDWQTRRNRTKFKTKNGETYYCFALNSTVVASPRILIAILENNQQDNGSVKIPQPLVKYTGFSEISLKPNKRTNSL